MPPDETSSQFPAASPATTAQTSVQVAPLSQLSPQIFAAVDSAPLDESIHFRDLWRVILKRKWSLIAFFLLVVVTVAIATMLQVPLYRAVISLKIERDAPKVVEYKDVTPTESTFDADFYRTQYELLKSRSYRADLLTIDVDDLKETLDVETKYKNYADFKRFVLLQGQKDLTKSCDISYTFDEIKEGKKVKTLTFKVFENRPDKAKKDGEIMVKKAVGAATQGGLFGEIYPQVEGWGVGSEVLQLLIETQPEDALRNGLTYTKWALEEGKIKENTAGFFITAVKNKYTTPQYENAKRRAELVREAKKREVEIKQLEVMLADMRDDFQTARNDAVRDVVDAHPDATNRAVEVVKAQNQTYFELKQMNIDHLTLADFREDKILRGLVIQEIEAQNPTFFTEINVRFPEQIKNLERKIKALKRG